MSARLFLKKFCISGIRRQKFLAARLPLIFSYAGVAVIDRPKFFLPQKRLMEKSEMYPESDRTEDK